MRKILDNPSFRNLWLAGLLSMLGSQISRIGLVLYVFEQHDTLSSLAFLVVLETLPGAVVAPFAGAVIDRFNKRDLMIASDVIRALLMTCILIWPTLGVIYLMAALHSIATVFFQPAKSAAIPLILDRRDVAEANGLDQSSSNLVLIIGPIVGAQLLIYFGLAATMIVDVASFLLGAFLISRVAIRRPRGGDAEIELDPEAAAALGTLGEIREGWSYLRGHQLMMVLNLLLLNALLCAGIWMPLAPFFIRDFLGGAENVLGWQIGVFGVGSVLGGLLAPRWTERLGKGNILILGMLGEGFSMAAYAVTGDLWLSTAMIFLWGIAASAVVVPFYSILQLVVEERFLGRMFTVVKQVENWGIVFAMLAAIVLHELFSSQLILLAGGLLYVGVTAAASALTPSGRALLATR